MKKKLSKIVTAILVFTMVFALTACDGSVNENTDKKALLVVSFGSSFADNRALALDATEDAIQKAFPDRDFYNAFTSQIIIDVYKDRDGIEIDNVKEAMEKIYDEGYGDVLVVPTHVISGEENEEMNNELDLWKDKFDTLTISTPLLTTYDDYLSVIDALKSELPKATSTHAVVLMGHGTPHAGNAAYGCLDYILKDEGNPDMYVGTVEGFPTFNTVLKNLKAGDYKEVTLIPAMMVAGDHAHNDMAGDEEDSWKNMLKAEGYDVDIVMHGLGELPAVQNLFVEHANTALEDK